MNSDAEVIEQIVIALRRPLRQKGAEAAIATALRLIREEAARPFPDAASIRRHASRLRQSLAPFGTLQTPGAGGGSKTLQEFLDELDWFEHITGPSPSIDMGKHLCSVFADGLTNQFCMEPPTGTENGPVREIASLLYLAVYGEDADLKYHIDGVRKTWRNIGMAGRRKGTDEA
jgi:hypothetical protein